MEKLKFIFLPDSPGNKASVTPATSMGALLKYVHKIKPIAAQNSPIIGISMHGLPKMRD